MSPGCRDDCQGRKRDAQPHLVDEFMTSPALVPAMSPATDFSPNHLELIVEPSSGLFPTTSRSSQVVPKTRECLRKRAAVLDTRPRLRERVMIQLDVQPNS